MWILRQSVCRPVPETILMVITTDYYEKLLIKRGFMKISQWQS